MSTAPRPTDPQAGEVHVPTGLAHVATVSFLASRLAPTGAFFLALAGGVALARAGQRWGARQGYGASLAAMLQTVAIMGPARINGPLTQALTAPMMGRLEARGVAPLPQGLACAAIRLLHNAVVSLVAIFILVGPKAYTGTYERVANILSFLPQGGNAAYVLTAVGLLLWAAFASTVQVIVYRRGLRRWPSSLPDEEEHAEPLPARDAIATRFDPRAIALAATVAFALLIASRAWPLLAAVTVWLVLASLVARLDRGPLRAGAALAGLLAAGALSFSLIAGLGWEEALSRGWRAGLLVLVATWLRAAAGSEGLREVFRRALTRLRRLPSTLEAGSVMAELDSGPRLLGAGGALVDALGPVRKRPRPVVDAVIDWVAHESGRFRVAVGSARRRLSFRARDAVLVAAALLPAAAFAA